MFRIAQKFDGKNYDKLIVGFKGETLRDKGCRENFDKSLAICQSCPPSNFCAIRYVVTVVITRPINILQSLTLLGGPFITHHASGLICLFTQDRPMLIMQTLSGDISPFF